MLTYVFETAKLLIDVLLLISMTKRSGPFPRSWWFFMQGTESVVPVEADGNSPNGFTGSSLRTILYAPIYVLINMYKCICFVYIKLIKVRAHIYMTIARSSENFLLLKQKESTVFLTVLSKEGGDSYSLRVKSSILVCSPVCKRASKQQKVLL